MVQAIVELFYYLAAAWVCGTLALAVLFVMEGCVGGPDSAIALNMLRYATAIYGVLSAIAVFLWLGGLF